MTQIKPLTYTKPMKILFFRNGGFGDILLTTPALRGLKEKYPESEITYLCYKECAFLPKNNPFVDQVLTTENFWPPYPEFFELAPNYDLFFNLYLAVENEYYLKKWDRMEAFCDVIGVKPSKFELILNLEKQKDKTEEKLIAVHTEGTAAERCWPSEYYTELIEMLINDGFKVLLLGKELLKEKIKDSRIIDKCGKLTFQESLYELSGCAALIGPDSAFYHCAAALNIPFVTIFGPIPPELRTKHYKGKKFKALRKSSCPPCHHYPRCGINPTNQEQKGKAPCMAAVTPKIVKEALYELLS